MTSTLTDSTANWDDDEHAGRVVYPNVNATNGSFARVGDLSYRVLGNTATMLTIDDAINLEHIAPGDRYAVIYGKLIKEQIKVPGSGTPGIWKQVKFFSNHYQQHLFGQSGAEWRGDQRPRISDSKIQHFLGWCG
ncbi:MAG: hypothetical protein L3J26_11310 [Candidatus Polarisedimenticolaceae bacterium]|nr:hypothetical protein [Candidatus Polarisedimenticolaceae bacterium]